MTAARILVLLTFLAGSVSSLEYNNTANSWARYSKWNLCPNNEAILYLQIKTNSPDGLIAYMDDGPNAKDYLLLKLKDGRVALEYRFGESGLGPAMFARTDKAIQSGDDDPTFISIRRRRMVLELELDDGPGTRTQIADFGDDLCFGECRDDLRYTLSSGVSDLYIGGLPPAIRARAERNINDMPPQFNGEIYDVEYKNCECRRSNPYVLEIGAELNPASDICFNKTSSQCVCKIDGETCQCLLCETECNMQDPITTYNLGFGGQENAFIKNTDGLDARVIGSPSVFTAPMKYLKLENQAYLQMAGESQRDECLGNLAFCPDGYTLSFWMVIYNDDLSMRDGILVDNGGFNSHGVAVYWKDGALYTKFVKPNGDTWTNEALELYPAKIYHGGDGTYVDYWYHYAASWSETRGLKVYFNGEPVGRSSNNPAARIRDVRTPFNLGSIADRSGDNMGISDPSANMMGIAEINFASEYRERDQILQYMGPRHYYFSMNKLEGSRLTSWPDYLDARVSGGGQLVRGRADNALSLGRSQSGTSYVDAGDISNTCFANVESCDMYASFWIKFDQLSNGMTILDTGKSGVTFQYRDQQLMALLYPNGNNANPTNPMRLTFNNPAPGQWYFVELDRNTNERMSAKLYINGQLVDQQRTVVRGRPTSALRHLGEEKRLLIGKKNADAANSYPVTGAFSIDELELLQGNREFLRDIGHIQRGIPPHAFYNMDGFSDSDPGYLSYIYRNIRLDPRAEIEQSRTDYQFVPGKDMMGLKLTGSTFEITQNQRSQECYNNIEKCHHGVLVRGWFNLEDLQNNAGIMSTGLNGIDMSYQNGRMLVTADTSDKRWQVELDDIPERKWQFLEVSFHPKYGLVVYRDQKKAAETVTYSSPNIHSQSGSNRFVVGGTNNGNQVKIPMIVDDFEVWYGTKDYVDSVVPQCDSRHQRWLIDFDSFDVFNTNLLRHDELTISATGVLESGLYDQALTLRGGSGQMAEISQIKPNVDVRDHCIGNLTMCERGFTVWFYVKPVSGSLQDNGRRTYFLSTGTNGIDVFYLDGRLNAEARADDRKWEVSSPVNYLAEDAWNTIIVAWSPLKGLVLARDEQMYEVARDVIGTFMENAVDQDMNSRFLIGSANNGVNANNFARGLNAAFDDMRIDECFLTDNLGPLAPDSVSFERNHNDRNIVEHPKWNIRLNYGASIVEGLVGNATLLNGNGQFVDLGSHTDTCIDNLDKCDNGMVLTFRVNPKGGSYQENQVIMSGSSYDISLVENSKLQVKLMSEDKQWEVKSYSIPFDQWTNVDVAWTNEQGLELYVGGSKVGEDRQGQQQSRVSGSRLLIGKANNQANRRYYNGMVDEIRFFPSTYRELVKKDIIRQDTCAIPSVIVTMDAIDGDIVRHDFKNDIKVHNNPRVVDGLLGNGIELEDYQHIDVGSRLTCQSRPSACANGFTMRFSMKPSLLASRSYLISSNPAEVVFGDDGNLHVSYRAVAGKWESSLFGLEMDVWYTIDLSWDNENGMTVYVNNMQRSWSQLTTSAVDNYNQSNHFFINKPSSPLVREFDQSEFVVDNLQIWDAKRELLISCGLLPPPPEAVKHHAVYPPNGGGYIRLFYIPTEYDIPGYMNEELEIKFETGTRDGLLWYNQDGDIRSWTYLKNGDLWFATKNGDRPIMERQITFNQNLADGKDHNLLMRSTNGNPLIFYLDGSEVKSITTDHKIRFIKEDFNVGGHKDPTGVTGGLVTSSFIGTIKDVIINGTGYDKGFDIFAEMWKDQFPAYVRASCDMVFTPEIAFICDHGNAPVTFTENNTYISVGQWANAGKKPSVEVRFTTPEPRGLLLFTGSRDSDFFALEVFDRKLYMVTDVGNGIVRKQVSTGDVSDNVPHTAKFVFNSDEGRINVFFDGQRLPGQDVDLPVRGNPNALFEQSMYLGGYPNYNLLPWKIWSEAGFIGCVEDLQVNTIASKLQDLYRTQRAINIEDGCRAFPNFCASNPCMNNAPCYNRKDRYHCDCTGLDYANHQNDVCARLTLVGNINGTTYHDIDLGRNIKTHVNDISTKFMTLAEDGTMWMTHSPTSPEYIKVFFEDGDLKVEVNTGERYEVTTIPGTYNDYEWHTLNVKRRADEMSIWVDDKQPVKVDLSEEDFYIYMNTIRLGANIPDPGQPPYFLGHLRTFIEPPVITGPPFIDTTVVPVPINSVTFLTPEAFIRLPNNPEEMKTDFKVILMIKTKQRDSLFMYQPGTRNNQYLAALLKDGGLNVRFNFGGTDELIAVPGDLSDDRWHMIELSRPSVDQLSVRVDRGLPINRRLRPESAKQFDHTANMFIGGIPANLLIADGLRNIYTEDVTGYRGCMATFVKARRLFDIGNEIYQDAEVRTSGSVVRGCQVQPVCESSQCLNSCVCSASGAFCDSSTLPFVGQFCERPDIGYKFYVDRTPGHVQLVYLPPISTDGDKISFGFITCKESGTLAKISGQSRNEYIKIYLQRGRIVVEYQLGGTAVGQLKTSRKYSDSKLYTVQFERSGLQGELLVRDPAARQLLETKATLISGRDTRLDNIEQVEVGSEYDMASGGHLNPFDGVIIGFKHGINNVFRLTAGTARGTSMKLPGTSLLSDDPISAFECITDLGLCGPDRQTCQNFGVCMNNQCNCTLTAYTGSLCNEHPVGHYYGFKDFKPGFVKHEYPSAVTTYKDYLAIGVMTYEPNGTIFRVESVDGTQYYDVRLVNGKAQLEYRLADNQIRVIKEDRVDLNSRDSIYHVIRMNRTGSNITFYVDDLQMRIEDINIANVPFRNQKHLMSGGVMWADQNKIEDDWNGILGGLNYNSKFMYHIPFDSNTIGKFGDVEIPPVPYKLKFPPPPQCQSCSNGGLMLDGACDCMYTGFGGICCATRVGLWGFQTKKVGGNSVVIYQNNSMGGSRVDDLSVSFRTADGWSDGEMVRIASKDGLQYMVVEIVNDQARVRYNLCGTEYIENFQTVTVREQRDHHIRLHRNGNGGYIELDNIKRGVNFPGCDVFSPSIIYTGGAWNGSHASSGHYGILWGVNYNGKDIVDITRRFDAKANGITVHSDGIDNFDIVPYPWPALCSKGSLDPACSITPPPPLPGGGAGGIIPKIGVPIVPVPVPGGIETGVRAIPIGAIIAAVMGGLLFSSAIVFAAAGMKPGFFALSKGMAAGAGGKGAYVPVVDKAGAFPVSNGGNYIGTVGMEEYGAGAGSQAGSRRSQYEESFTQESRFDGTDGGMIAAGMNGGMNGGAMMNGGGYNNTYNTTSSWYQRNETLQNEAMAAGYGGGSTIGGYGRGGAGYAGSVAGGSVSGSVYGFGTVTNPDQAFITLSEDIAVDNVVLTGDGRYVVTGSNLGPPQVWNTNNGEMVTTMRGDFMGSTGLHLAANEQYLIGETMAEQAAVDMNDVQTGNHIPIRRVAVWDFSTGNPLPIAVDQLCTASCVSKDGYKVVMAMTDKFGGGTTVKVLDLLSNKVLHEITYPDTIGVADSASCVFISPDDRFVAVGFTNSFDNNANFIVFDLFNKGGVMDSPIVALNADPHCTVILNHDEALTGTRNGELVIWSMKTGKAQRQLTSGDATMLGHGGMPAAHDREVKEVALSDDGKFLASASVDRTVKVWNMDSESLLHTLHGHNDEVWTVDIASDNSILVSGSQDGTIKLWRLRNGNQITSFNATMDIFHARFSKDKKTVVALGDKFGARKLIMLQIVSQKKWRMRSS